MASLRCYHFTVDVKVLQFYCLLIFLFYCGINKIKIMHDFATKRNALFACLDDASTELKGTVLDQANSTTALSRTAQGGLEMNYRQGGGSRNKQTATERTLHHLRGKESIFKKPELPIARCLKPRRLPDYQVCIIFQTQISLFNRSISP